MSRESREEPCTIDAADVAEFLERQRSPKRAEYVRHLGRLCRESYAREQQLRDDISRLAERLWQHEGRPTTTIRDPKSDD